jgi:Tfp pilus assembly ATPase PilU
MADTIQLFNNNKFSAFVNEIMKTGTKKGMQFIAPKLVHLVNEDSLTEWSNMFNFFAQNNFDFVLYIGEHSKNVAGDDKTNHSKINF